MKASDKKKIQLVEDESIIALDVSSCLEEMGYEIVANTANAHEAVELAGTHRPDLVLMDITLSSAVDGIEAAQLIRDRFGIPVVYMTGNSDFQTIDRALKTKPYGYITKPISKHGLYSAITSAFMRHSSECAIISKNIEQEYVHTDLQDTMEELEQTVEELDRTNEELHAVNSELIRSRSILFAALDQSPAGIIIADAPDVKIRYVNKAAEKIILTPVEQMRDISFAANDFAGFTCYRPDGTGYALRELPISQTILSQNTFHNVEMKIIRNDGTERWILVNGSPIVSSDRSLIGGITVFLDITDQRLSEEKTRTINDLYNSILENIQETFYRSDKNGKLIMGSPSGGPLFGYDSVDEMINMDLSQLWENPDDRQKILAEIKEKGFVRNFVGKMVRKNGSPFFASVSAHFYRDENGDIAGAEGIIRDITEHITSAKEKEKLEQELLRSQRLEFVGRLAGGVAHDFNNLLTPILLCADMMLHNCPESDPHYEDLMHIKSAADQARSLTRQLLAYGRKQMLELQPINIVEVIHSFSKIIKRTLRENISIEISAEENIPAIVADYVQIEQVLMNLAVNAQDAISDNGTFSVKISSYMPDDAMLKKHHDLRRQCYVHIQFADTGKGMDEKTLENIFEPFFTTKGIGEGTGLGLSTVYGIVKQHNGSIYVHSQPGKGSVFDVYFPAISEKVVVVEKEKRAPENGKKHLATIILVEDNDSVRDSIFKLLVSEGYKTLICSSLYDCILLKNQGVAVDLLLSDVIMPGMNGRELYDVLKQHWPGLRVLFMSGYDRKIIVKQGIIEDGINLIQKPFTPDALFGMIEKVMGS
jgi:two-component system, cell cycle sensor histidine kinase and response regulator CckA